MEMLRIAKEEGPLEGIIHLKGSKSISNRVLIIRALCNSNFAIQHLAEADDTQVLKTLLDSSHSEYNVGHAGTSYRFLTAFLSIQNGTQILTGSNRMKQRPIGPLVEALKRIGADIEYLENPGYPPLKINEFKYEDCVSELSLTADISSQFISALLLIAPVLPKGLTILLENTPVSVPYISMTLKIMAQFGVKSEWNGNSIKIEQQAYVPKDFLVESDWSAASYYFGLASSNPNTLLKLEGLFEESAQGDAAIRQISEKFGVESSFEDGCCLIQNNRSEALKHFKFDFIKQPDLAQTVSVMCANLGVEAIFSGLKTLRIKETDRIAALQNELRKINVHFDLLPKNFAKKTKGDYFIQNGKAEAKNLPIIHSYDDHRMAMAFSLLALKFPILIEDPYVVNKSYPGYWEDLASIGFDLKFLDLTSG